MTKAKKIWPDVRQKRRERSKKEIIKCGAKGQVTIDDYYFVRFVKENNEKGQSKQINRFI